MWLITHFLFNIIALSFISRKVSGFHYVGCFWNDENNTLADHFPPASTTIECFVTCISTGYTYAGTQADPRACNCGNVINDQGKLQDSQCNAPCPSTSGDLCGGYHRLAVYNITNEIIPVVIRQQQEDVTTQQNIPQSTNTGCMCPCSVTSTKWNYLHELNVSREELVGLLQNDIEELKQNLTISVKATSAYKNTKISAPDNRQSSVMMGAVGGFIMCIPVILIVGSDVTKLFKNRKNKINKLL